MLFLVCDDRSGLSGSLATLSNGVPLRNKNVVKEPQDLCTKLDSSSFPRTLKRSGAKPQSVNSSSRGPFLLSEPDLDKRRWGGKPEASKHEQAHEPCTSNVWEEWQKKSEYKAEQPEGSRHADVLRHTAPSVVVVVIKDPYSSHQDQEQPQKEHQNSKKNQ